MDKALEQAKDRWKDGREAVLEQHARMREDLKFSNPADPKQWDDSALKLRTGRPCLTFDRTNQFISQVVNDARQNKPSIYCIPADSHADVAVAEKINGIIRHIEYTSRAGIAYDMAIESSARCGMGWLRVVPEIVKPETNEQEIRIKRIHDVFSVTIDPNSTEPDGMDAMWGHIETSLTSQAFERLYPKAKKDSWDSDGWFTKDSVRICEEFLITEKEENRITVEINGQRAQLTEDEYWEAAGQLGFKPPVLEQFVAKIRKQKWRKFSGCEILEETEFPSIYIPLIPVLGYEIWIDDKRYICGMTRRLMDSQRAYNYERSAFIEAVALQPKAPFMAASEAIEGFEDDWRRSNSGNPAYLPFNAYDDAGNALPMPQRQNPPAFPVAFAQGGQLASQDMESSIGMFKANLGQQGNETSGRAIRARQQEGDTANFHYVDNLSRSIEQLGRIVVDMIPRIYDTPRQARIVGEDGTQDFVRIDPKMPQAAAKEGKRVVAINPGVGSYDVRVKAGPSYTSLRQESAEQLGLMIQSAPNLMPILGDVWVRMQDWPDADKVSQRLKAMLPPNLKALEDEDNEGASMVMTSRGPVPADQAGQIIDQMDQQMQQMAPMLEKQQQELAQKQEELKAIQTEIEKQAQQLAYEKSLMQTRDSLTKQLLQAQEQAADAEQKAALTEAISQVEKLIAGYVANVQSMVDSIKTAEQPEPEETMAEEPNPQDVLREIIQANNEQMMQQIQAIVSPIVALLSSPRTLARDVIG